MTDRKKGWGRKLKLASVPIVLASLAACATPFNADVSRFQTQLPAPQGESYFVVADDPALAGGLEFAQYADLVEAQMSRLGYAQAASAENASLLVRFDYGVNVYGPPVSAILSTIRGLDRAGDGRALAMDALSTVVAGASVSTIHGSAVRTFAATRFIPVGST